MNKYYGKNTKYEKENAKTQFKKSGPKTILSLPFVREGKNNELGYILWNPVAFFISFFFKYCFTYFLKLICIKLVYFVFFSVGLFAYIYLFIFVANKRISYDECIQYS